MIEPFFVAGVSLAGDCRRLQQRDNEPKWELLTSREPGESMDGKKQPRQDAWRPPLSDRHKESGSEMGMQA